MGKIVDFLDRLLWYYLLPVGVLVVLLCLSPLFLLVKLLGWLEGDGDRRED